MVYELNNVQFNLTRPYYILLAFGQAADGKFLLLILIVISLVVVIPGSSITKHNQVQLSTSQVAVSEDNDVIMMGDGESNNV